MNTRVAPKITNEAFEAVLPRLGKLDVETVEVARAVLVEGAKPVEIATRLGMSRQRIHHIVRRFRAATREVPTEWRRVEVWLPEALAARVEALAEKARADYVRSPSPTKLDDGQPTISI